MSKCRYSHLFFLEIAFFVENVNKSCIFTNFHINSTKNAQNFCETKRNSLKLAKFYSKFKNYHQNCHFSKKIQQYF